MDVVICLEWFGALECFDPAWLTEELLRVCLEEPGSNRATETYQRPVVVNLEGPGTRIDYVDAERTVCTVDQDYLRSAIGP